MCVTTQYVGEAAYCDYVGLLSDGELLLIDTPENLRKAAFDGEVVDIELSREVEPAELARAVRGRRRAVRDRSSVSARMWRLVVDDADAGDRPPRRRAGAVGAADHRDARAHRRLRRGVRPGHRAAPLERPASDADVDGDGDADRDGGAAPMSIRDRRVARRERRGTQRREVKLAKLRQGTQPAGVAGVGDGRPGAGVRAQGAGRDHPPAQAARAARARAVRAAAAVRRRLQGHDGPAAHRVRRPRGIGVRAGGRRPRRRARRVHRSAGLHERPRTAAVRRLEDGELDAVVVFPTDALDQILGGESAKIEVLHEKLDPFQQAAIDIASRLAVQEVNAVGARAPSPAAPSRRWRPSTRRRPRSPSRPPRCRPPSPPATPTAMADAAGTVAEHAARRPARDGDVAGRHRPPRRRRADAARRRARPAGVGRGRRRRRSAPAAAPICPSGRPRWRRRCDEVADGHPAGHHGRPGRARAAVRGRHRERRAGRRSSRSTTSRRSSIALLLQHLALTFAALSLVRDRELGLLELLRVGPLSSMRDPRRQDDRLPRRRARRRRRPGRRRRVRARRADAGRRRVGRGHRGARAAGLAGAGHGAVDDLRVRRPRPCSTPCSACWPGCSSPGSSSTSSQLATPYRYLSYVLPVTYGISMLHDVMLRGVDPGPADLIGLGALVVVYGSLAVRAPAPEAADRVTEPSCPPASAVRPDQGRAHPPPHRPGRHGRRRGRRRHLRRRRRRRLAAARRPPRPLDRQPAAGREHADERRRVAGRRPRRHRHGRQLARHAAPVAGHAVRRRRRRRRGASTPSPTSPRTSRRRSTGSTRTLAGLRDAAGIVDGALDALDELPIGPDFDADAGLAASVDGVRGRPPPDRRGPPRARRRRSATSRGSSAELVAQLAALDDDLAELDRSLDRSTAAPRHATGPTPPSAMRARRRTASTTSTATSRCRGSSPSSSPWPSPSARSPRSTSAASWPAARVVYARLTERMRTGVVTAASRPRRRSPPGWGRRAAVVEGSEPRSCSARPRHGVPPRGAPAGRCRRLAWLNARTLSSSSRIWSAIASAVAHRAEAC